MADPSLLDLAAREVWRARLQLSVTLHRTRASAAGVPSLRAEKAAGDQRRRCGNYFFFL